MHSRIERKSGIGCTALYSDHWLDVRMCSEVLSLQTVVIGSKWNMRQGWSADLPALSAPTFAKTPSFQHQTVIQTNKIRTFYCSLIPSRWPVGVAIQVHTGSHADRLQNQRTRLSTIRPRRLTETGTISFCAAVFACIWAREYDRLTHLPEHSIKKPKTHRYPSLKGTDPKFRRNHRHALHGTMKALKEVKEGKRDAA